MRKYMYCENCGEKICIPLIAIHERYQCPHCNTKNDIYFNSQVKHSKALQSMQYILILLYLFIPGFAYGFESGIAKAIYSFCGNSLWGVLWSILIMLVLFLLLAPLWNTITVALFYPSDKEEPTPFQ